MASWENLESISIWESRTRSRACGFAVGFALRFVGPLWGDIRLFFPAFFTVADPAAANIWS
jgi:hypothetical protein